MGRGCREEWGCGVFVDTEGEKGGGAGALHTEGGCRCVWCSGGVARVLRGFVGSWGGTVRMQGAGHGVGVLGWAQERAQGEGFPWGHRRGVGVVGQGPECV